VDTKEAGNGIIRCTCRGERTDILINPLMILIAIISYLVFAFYYMTIVRDIELKWTLPVHFAIAVFALVIIGAILALAVCYLISLRNYSHWKRENDLRARLILYLELRREVIGANIGDDIDYLKDTDAKIFRSEIQPFNSKKVIYILIVPLIIMVISLFVEVLRIHLGEITIVMMLLTLLTGLLAFPEMTSFSYDHERNFIRFYDQIRDISSSLRLEIPEFNATIPERSYGKLAKYSVCTLSILTPYWAYILISDMNSHIRNQRIVENAFIEEMWKDEMHFLRD